VVKILFFMQAIKTLAAQHEQDLNLEIGDMIGVTHFDKPQLHMFGVLLDEEHRHNWWEFEAVPYEEAIRQPHGRFPESAVCLP